MKRILILIVFMVLCLSSTSAFADPANTKSWTGFYAGLQGTYAHGNTDWEYINFLTRADHTINGWTGGIFAGYNYQFPINVVVGIETDINYGKISGSTSCPNPNWLATSEVSWVGSTRARVGYAVWRFLPYIATGVAYGRAKIYETRLIPGVDYSSSDTYIGWTPSIGLEFAITKNLMARAEYSYYDFGKKTVLLYPTDDSTVHITFQGIKFGLSWSFGGQKEASQARAKEVAPEPPPPQVGEMKKAPEAAAQVEQKIIEKGRVTLNVEFDTGKAIVKPAYYKEIEGVADIMKKYPELNIVIEGHTDNMGEEKYNLNLSQKRTEAIKEVMVKKFKIESARITPKGFGYSKPIADNSTKEGRKSNRRVEASLEYTIKK